MKTRILLADDHAIVRQSLRSRLEAEPDFDLVGEAKDGLVTLAQVERLRPDVLLLDIAMPGLNGIEVLTRVRQRFPRTHVVVLSMHQDRSYVVRSFQNGAQAYVVKSADAKDLVHAIREVMAGRQYLSPPFSAAELEDYMNKAASGDADPYDLLTRREREVQRNIHAGLGTVRAEPVPVLACFRREVSYFRKSYRLSVHDLLRHPWEENPRIHPLRR